MREDVCIFVDVEKFIMDDVEICQNTRVITCNRLHVRSVIQSKNLASMMFFFSSVGKVILHHFIETGLEIFIV